MADVFQRGDGHPGRGVTMLARYKWLEKATKKIRFGPDRKAVQAELLDHITDLMEHYAGAGMDEDAAEAAALEAMGDPEAIAEDLGRLHRPWLGYLWWLSKGLLFAAIGLCCVLCVWQICRRSSQTPEEHLPGWEFYDYLTWKFEIVVGEPEEYQLVPNGSVTTGGYTIEVERALMRHAGDPARGEQRWNLLLFLHIDTDWRCEELYWGPEVITEIRDNAGNLYGGWNHEPDKYYYSGFSSAAPFLGQKAALELNSVPEDIQWVELDIGYGRLMRTMHVDVIKEAGT